MADPRMANVNADGFNVVVYPIDNGWGARVRCRTQEWERKSRRLYATMEHAKLAAFDAMIIAKAAFADREEETEDE
jgi:hypothetical protein